MKCVLVVLLSVSALLACAGLVGGIGTLWSIWYFGFMDTDPADYYSMVLIISCGAILLPYGVRGIVLVLRNEHHEMGVTGKLVSALLIAFGGILISIAITSRPDRFMLLPGVVVAASPLAYVWLARRGDSPN